MKRTNTDTKTGRRRKAGSRALRSLLKQSGTGALTGDLAKQAETFKSEQRAALAYPGFGALDELDLERAACGWIRASRASAWELNQPFDPADGKGLAREEIGAGYRQMSDALSSIEARRKAPHAAEILKAIQETAPIADAGEKGPETLPDRIWDAQAPKVDRQDVPALEASAR